MTKTKFIQEVEARIQALTLNPFIRQNELAFFLEVSPKSVRAELEEKGVPLTRFGYPTLKVIKALELNEYLDLLKEFRA